MSKPIQTGSARSNALAALFAFLATLLALPVNAAIDVPDVPLQAGKRVPPNIMFILDDSGSMASAYMPDHPDRTNVIDISRMTYTRGALSYDPRKSYLPWMQADGEARMADTSVNSAFVNDARATDARNLADRLDDAFYLPKGDLASNPANATDYYRYQIRRINGMEALVRSEIYDVRTRLSHTALSVAKDGVLRYSFSVPDPAIVLDIELTGNNGDVDLYVRRGEPPTTDDNDCESTGPSSNERCYFGTGTVPAEWHVLLVGYAAASNFSIKATTAEEQNVVTMTAGLVPERPSIVDELKNIANWYSYHRTRMKVAKAGASEAFSGLDNAYRVGFDTIWNRAKGSSDPGSMSAPAYPIPGEFTLTNKNEWFSYLHAARASGKTPLHGALQRAGKYYQTAAPWQDSSGEEIACRQSFSILTTDGFWNDVSGYTQVGNADNLPVSGQYSPALPYKDGFSNTLADVAMEYWKTDLRPADNKVPTTSADPANWQHMVTFGISIGLRGTLDPAVDLPAITGGSKQWPDPTDVENQERIDDLWHAAVNGRGAFVVATDPTSFAEALKDALSAINQAVSSRSGVSASASSVDNGAFVFQSIYNTEDWSGELRAFRYEEQVIDDKTKKVLNPVPVWSTVGAGKFESAANRDVFTSGGSGGTDFPSSEQRAAMAARYADDADARFEWVLGDQSKEGAGGYRPRDHSVLGDIVHSDTLFVEGADPTANGVDTDDTIYVGANDGMVHAFDADPSSGGTERFAYVPRGIDMVELGKLANHDYTHKFFVDGALVATTRAQTSNRNILVGALGRGGKGLYALDVSDPASFGPDDVLWDRTWTSAAGASGWSDADTKAMGHVLGTPIISRTNDDETALRLIVPNGINSATGDASLFVLDLQTGSVIARVDAGQTGDNGLISIRGLDIDGDGDVDVVYGGDLKGNLLKFDLSRLGSGGGNGGGGSGGGKNAVSVVVHATDASGNAQPITGGLSVAYEPTTYKVWIVFGTGQLLTEDDLESRQVQSIYGVVDTGTTLARRDLKLREIEIEENGRRAFEPYSPLEGEDGWVIDLVPPSGTAEGERVTTQVQVVDGEVRLSSQIPSGDACKPVGSGWIYVLSAFTGTSTPQPALDTDGDGDFDEETLGSPKRSTGGVKNEEGMVGNLTDLSDRVVYGTTGAGSPDELGLKSGALTGRISWREIIGD